LKKAKSIMFQGTGSGVGKSIITAGFCRMLAKKGYSVAPFKAQNMALNSGVTECGLEMGRAQILQAEAAMVQPDIRMNPILLKPQGDSTSQLVRMGKPVGTVSARNYYKLSDDNFEFVKDAYDSLAEEFDYIVIEGAGSPAEINLQKTDIVNMRMAEYADADVYIVGDIDRGGVFAWLKGTYDLVPDKNRELIKGFIINRFRGDISLLQPGIDMFREIVDVPVVGTVKYLDIDLDEEDSQNIKNRYAGEVKLTVGVIRLPHISNFSDFLPLNVFEGVSIKFINETHEADDCDIIIIPGSKSTLRDLRFMHKRGFAAYLKSVYGQKLIIGVCGGYQMLGKSVKDPKGIEGDKGEREGLGLLNSVTVIEEDKTLVNKEYYGRGLLAGLSFSGYEIHMGRTLIEGEFTQLTSEQGLAVYDKENMIIGTYIHGLFESADVGLRILSLSGIKIEAENDYYKQKQEQLDYLANILEESLDVGYIIPDRD